MSYYFEDAADLLGLIVAFLGVFLGHLFQSPLIDALASIVIGLILTSISILLTRESRSLLMGESIEQSILDQVVKIADEDPAIKMINVAPLSMYMAPEEIILLLPAVFHPTLTAQEVTEAIERIKTNIETVYPAINKIFITPVSKNEQQARYYLN